MVILSSVQGADMLCIARDSARKKHGHCTERHVAREFYDAILMNVLIQMVMSFKGSLALFPKRP